MHFASCINQCVVCSVQCAVCSVQCSGCSVQCALCSVQSQYNMSSCFPSKSWGTISQITSRQIWEVIGIGDKKETTFLDWCDKYFEPAKCCRETQMSKSFCFKGSLPQNISRPLLGNVQKLAAFFLITSLSLQPELSRPCLFRIQGGSLER